MSDSDARRYYESATRKESVNENTPRRSSRKSVLEKRKVISEEVEPFFEVESIVEISERKHFKELLEEQDDIDGKTVFAFNTPKKKNAMASIAASAIFTPKTPRTLKIGSTPDVKRIRNELAMKTPKHIRSKLKKGISL